MNPSNVVVHAKEVYGRTLVYPVNEAAKNFALLVGKKTLDANALELIKKLGFQIVWARNGGDE